jgi:hypothetical protein
MNDIESRLADAMAARAREVEPHDEDDALNRISERVTMSHRRTFTILGIAAAVAVAVGSVALLNRGDDKETQHVNVATDSGNTSTTTNTTPATVIPAATPAIWPFASMNRTFATPEEAAKSFAVDYLGMTKARLGNTLPPADAHGASTVEVFPNDRASLRTLVNVVEQPPLGWVVVGATADEIIVDTPHAHDPLSSPLAVSGRSRAFEAQLNVSLRPYGSTSPVVEGFTMGGGTEILPFSTTITPPATDQPLVLVVFEGDASGEGLMAQATVIPLDAAGTPAPTSFVAITNADELVLLDFDGHVQRTLASQVAQFAYSPAAGLIAYTKLGEACAIDFVSLTSATAPASLSGSAPAFDDLANTLAMVNCDGGVDDSAADGNKRSTVYQGERIIRLAWLGDATLLMETDKGVILKKIVGRPDDPAPTELVTGVLPTVRGRFGSIAFFAGQDISSFNPNTGATVKLVTPAAEPISLDADESGRFLLWVDVNHDLWKWSGGDAVKVGSGFNAAAW